MMLTPDDLQAHIAAHGIAARLVRGLGDTRTVPLAAEALGVPAQQIVKSLLFLVQLPERAGDPPPQQRGGVPKPVLVICGGERQVDHRAVGAHFGVTRKKIRLAPSDVVLAVLGYPAGGVPPFGHRTQVPVILDAALLSLPLGDGGTVYGGGGDEGTMLETTVAELRRVLQPEVVSVTGTPASGRARS
jgi:prolyl-tRNA editing enzyme YbaK/EbsC (Cys-tRNA(Pro) deacylase)